MARFDRAIATAERLIERNGQPVKWKSNTLIADPDKPWRPVENEPVEHDATICFLPMSAESRALFAFLRGTNDVPAGYVYGLMKGNVEFEPALGDTVIRDGEVLAIRSIELLSPNGQKVLYTVNFE